MQFVHRSLCSSQERRESDESAGRRQEQSLVRAQTEQSNTNAVHIYDLQWLLNLVINLHVQQFILLKRLWHDAHRWYNYNYLSVYESCHDLVAINEIDVAAKPFKFRFRNPLHCHRRSEIEFTNHIIMYCLHGHLLITGHDVIDYEINNRSLNIFK